MTLGLAFFARPADPAPLEMNAPLDMMDLDLQAPAAPAYAPGGADFPVAYLQICADAAHVEIASPTPVLDALSDTVLPLAILEDIRRGALPPTVRSRCIHARSRWLSSVVYYEIELASACEPRPGSRYPGYAGQAP